MEILLVDKLGNFHEHTIDASILPDVYTLKSTNIKYIKTSVLVITDDKPNRIFIYVENSYKPANIELINL